MEAVELSSYLKGGLTRLFNALDRDQDGYLLASDIGLLGRVMLGRTVSETQARSELQRAKVAAQKKIGAKSTFQPDVLCLEEFLACSWFLEGINESEFEAKIQYYLDAIGRVTGTISSREQIMLKMAREHHRGRRVKETERDDTFDSDLVRERRSSATKGGVIQDLHGPNGQSSTESRSMPFIHSRQNLFA